ncbi:AAA family ATPase [Alkaliphilus peptidifermentans]|uniref:Flp pilus assembly protein, ATPase CpaE n=1 Tax=Alkaliphilus peptidifermentans DSM 18978 TaxID=1120976 RepID=A0A1G5DU08_9FIRM|nr:P-loop NTPase [Alkaliphilus peptidifermentans]SCY18067.1 Flp pilus assembly protein, ATPase CpaE [Alkaliphilus peptidifermentans DSM 18978]
MKNLDKKVYAIWSPKAGVGKSFLAAHLAKLSSQDGYLTGVIDFNRQSPSLPSILDIHPPNEKSLKEALLTDKDSDVIINFHNNDKKDKNIFCLALNYNNKVDELNELEDDKVLRLLELARPKFNILFLDLPTSYYELTSYESWKYADKIIVVIDNDYNSIVALKGYLKQFSEINIPLSKLVLIINKNLGILDFNEVKEISGLHVTAKIPFYKHVIKDLNEGKTVFENGGSYKDKKIIKGVNEVYNAITNEKIKQEQSTNAKKGFSLFKKKDKVAEETQ